jgi:hypothetical protein
MTQVRGKAASYDIVRAVRINGTPRHEFVLGLGTLYCDRDRDVSFWMEAVHRMTERGLTKAERKHFMHLCTLKGAPLPTREECTEHKRHMQAIHWWHEDDQRKLDILRQLLV